jgi:alkyl hydroperoxide reductase subunit AhpC
MTVDAYIRDEPVPARLRIEDYQGGWVAIVFLPPAAAAQPELARFDELRRAFAASDGLVIASSIEPWSALRDAPVSFPLVADTQGIVARAFGALVDGEPAYGTVLVDPAGEIRYDDLGRAVSADRALAALRRLRAAALRAAA